MNDDSIKSLEHASSPPAHFHDYHSAWPAKLLFAHDICQQSRLPMSIYWEKETRFLYNKAWSALLDKHLLPSGSPAQHIYGEQWKVVEASIARVIRSGESIQCDRQLFGNLHDRSHDGFFNYMLQPLSMENGGNAVLIIAERSYEDVEKHHDEFLATIAHELRNPFSALTSAAQLLNKAADRPQMMTMARDALTRQIGCLAQLLDDLLDVSRLRRGRLELRRQPVALKEVITAAIQVSRPVMENRQHNLIAEEPETSLYIDGDKHFLIKIFSSLLNHAAKHTESGRLLQLKTRAHEFGVDVIIHNTSFAPEMIQRAIGDCLERKFTRQLGKSIDISLYLICGLVQLHGGQISAHRDSAGNGTDLIVCLPRMQNP
ncbi:MAG: HAMP domain-containing sensor histidine kinase [Steroidobacter sp.]